jgi:hypothetical protein
MSSPGSSPALLTTVAISAPFGSPFDLAPFDMAHGRQGIVHRHAVSVRDAG